MKKTIRIAAISFAIITGLSGPMFMIQPKVSAASGCVTRVFAQGSSGSCVRVIQASLNLVAPTYLPPLYVDGIFGSATKSKVINYQNSRVLYADGIVGKQTWKQLCNDLRANGSSAAKTQYNAAGCTTL